MSLDLVKTPCFLTPGDRVKVKDLSTDKMKQLQQQRCGWKDDMAKVGGRESAQYQIYLKICKNGSGNICIISEILVEPFFDIYYTKLMTTTYAELLQERTVLKLCCFPFWYLELWQSSYLRGSFKTAFITLLI